MSTLSLINLKMAFSPQKRLKMFFTHIVALELFYCPHSNGAEKELRQQLVLSLLPLNGILGCQKLLHPLSPHPVV